MKRKLIVGVSISIIIILILAVFPTTVGSKAYGTSRSYKQFLVNNLIHFIVEKMSDFKIIKSQWFPGIVLYLLGYVIIAFFGRIVMKLLYSGYYNFYDDYNWEKI